MRQTISSVFFSVILVLSIFTNWYTLLGILLLLVLMEMVLHKIGSGIVLLEITALLYVFTCIIMPLIGYEYYSYSNRLSKLWVSYMAVKPDIYFTYALPAITCFCLAITWPSFKRQLPDTGKSLMNKLDMIRKKLDVSGNIGMQVVLTGFAIFLLAKFLPAVVGYVATLFFFGSFAGLLYIYFSPAFRYKKLMMTLFLVFILWNALQSGMFTVVVYMGITIFSFFQIGKKSSMFKKVMLMLVTIVFFIVLQNVKGFYRKNTWNKPYEGNKVELFSNLFIQNIQRGNDLFSSNALFPIYSRTNQGFNVALVMKRMPAIQPHDNGERLLTVFASAFVPRFLWADKPEAGGQFNMKYYAGWKIKGWSTNVGPLGEAYGSFGVAGGIFYMFLLGLFLRWVYLKVFVLSDKFPLLVCWLPVLFYMVTSSAETDTLQILNSIIKSAFFIWLLSKLLPAWFGINKEAAVMRRPVIKPSME